MRQPLVRTHHVERAEFTWIPVLGGLACLSAEYRDHAFAPHTHDTFVVGVFESGAAAVRSESALVTVGVRDVLAINPEAVHSAGPAVAEGWRYRAIYPTSGEWLLRWCISDDDTPECDVTFSTNESDANAMAARLKPLMGVAVEESAGYFRRAYAG